MLRLKTRMVEPAGGWVYRDEEMKVRLRAGSFNQLVQSVRSMRAANKLEIPAAIAEIVEDQVCRNTHKDFVANPEDSLAGMVTSADMITAMNRFTAARIPLASNLEHDLRAVICHACNHNCPTVCLSCSGFDAAYRQRFGLQERNGDNLLHVCQIDGTALLAVTWLVLKDMAQHLVQKAPYPKHCWKNQENPNG